jgi:hypothetical protein
MELNHVHPAGGPLALAAAAHTTQKHGFVASGVRLKTGAGTVPDAPLDCPPLPRTAASPVLVIPETEQTHRPPPDELVSVAVHVVEIAEGIRAVLTQAFKIPEVENPV